MRLILEIVGLTAYLGFAAWAIIGHLRQQKYRVR